LGSSVSFSFLHLLISSSLFSPNILSVLLNTLSLGKKVKSEAIPVTGHGGL
jgi:hypothetical protein